MNYMLDTNICIYIINTKSQSVLEKFLTLKKNDRLSISAISVAELFFGLEKSQSHRKEQNKIALIAFLSNLEVLSFDEYAAMEYGKIRLALQKNGTIIGHNDLLISAHALSLDAILVTNNEREFKRVEGLRVENWV